MLLAPRYHGSMRFPLAPGGGRDRICTMVPARYGSRHRAGMSMCQDLGPGLHFPKSFKKSDALATPKAPVLSLFHTS
eukprot:6798506-Prymnesium_polylepis.1